MMGMWYTYLWKMGHEIMGKKKSELTTGHVDLATKDEVQKQ